MKKLLTRNLLAETKAKYCTADDAAANNLKEAERVVLRNALLTEVPAGSKLHDFGCGVVIAGTLAEVSDLPDDFEARKRKIEYDGGWGFEFKDGNEESWYNAQFLLATADGIFVA